MKKTEIKIGKKLVDKMKYKSNPKDWETPTGESETVQDDSLTIKQLMDRAKMGLPLSKGNAFFSDVQDDEFDDHDYGKLKDADLDDLIDAKTEADEVAEKYEELKKKSEEKKEEKKEEKQEEKPDGEEEEK